MSDGATRHVLGISGGKDSAALAVYLRDRVPEMEYYFCDTGKELPETYEFLQSLEVALGQSIARLNSDRDFDHWLWMRNGLLPSANVRWCTPELKIKPFEQWIGDDRALSYIAIRADENRKGYLSSKANIQPVYPFIEDGIDISGVHRILEDAGVGLPSYYSWRTRSGCYFCFFQRKKEWLGLYDQHPDLFQKAVEYENHKSFEAAASDEHFTWSQGETLIELLARRDEIEANHETRMGRRMAADSNRALFDVFADALDDDDATPPCLACSV